MQGKDSHHCLVQIHRYAFVVSRAAASAVAATLMVVLPGRRRAALRKWDHLYILMMQLAELRSSQRDRLRYHQEGSSAWEKIIGRKSIPSIRSSASTVRSSAAH
jgi:hypothetical protein